VKSTNKGKKKGSKESKWRNNGQKSKN